MIKSCVYKNVFSQGEVDLILDYFARLPVANELNGNIDKNLDYHVKSSLAYKLIKPKINSIIGEHNFQNGSYKECTSPYTVHIDNRAWWDDGTTYTFDVEQKHECFLLIPLVTDTRFRTVIFDVLSADKYLMGEIMPQEWLGEKNSLDLQDFSHIKSDTKEQVQYLPLDIDAVWQAGDVIRWHRNQLHCSSDYAKYSLTKKFILLGIG